jgi:hypothetical protein
MTSGIARSVWSFWTKPFRTHRQSIWFSEKHHLLAWVLSLETARQHYPDTTLITDDEGAEMLVDGIGLEFDSVSTELNALSQEDPDWWILGKLWAYRSQTQPFLHLDTDVFLWKPLPDRLNSAPVLAQNPEDFVFGQHDATCWWYRPELFDDRVKQTGGWLPQEWDWYIARQRNLAYCCGIVGGNRVDFLTHYADNALQMATNSRNQAAFNLMENKPGDCLLIEQYFLAACVEYHQQAKDSAFQNITVECLFDSPSAAFSSERATQLGYTHLIGAAKRDKAIARRLEKRVAQEYPAQYERCLRYLEKLEFYLASESLASPCQTPDPAPLVKPDLQPAFPAIATTTAAAIPLGQFNQVIQASWHHEQVMTRQELAELMRAVGLVVQFTKPVRVDSLHPNSVFLWSHRTDGIQMEQRVVSPQIHPVQVTQVATQTIQWRVGTRDRQDRFDLITAVEPLETGLFTTAVQLMLPEALAAETSITGLTVVLRGDWIVNEEFLFDFGVEFQGHLEQCYFSPELRQQFHAYGIGLSEQATIAPETELAWRLSDPASGYLYIIRREETQLTLYQSRALDGNHLYPGVPERPSGNGSEGGDWLSLIHLTIHPDAVL